MTESDLSNPIIDEHFNIHEQVRGANSVCVRPSCDQSHINLYIHKHGQDTFHIEIPKACVEISHTEYGLVASSV